MSGLVLRGDCRAPVKGGRSPRDAAPFRSDVDRVNTGETLPPHRDASRTPSASGVAPRPSAPRCWCARSRRRTTCSSATTAAGSPSPSRSSATAGASGWSSSVAPDVQLEQDVEELLFRAYSLYRQVDLTFEAGRDRALCLRMLYGVIAGLFKELDRNAATHAEGAPVESTRVEYLEAALEPRRGLLPPRRPAPRAVALPRGRDRRPDGDRGRRLPARARPLDAPRPAGPVRHVPGVSLIAGGMGALLSVLYGMTSGNLRLHTLFANAESSRGPLVAAGALRPLRRRALGHGRLRPAAERLHPAQGARRRRGHALLHRDRDRRRLQRALGARRAGGHRGAHQREPRSRAPR